MNLPLRALARTPPLALRLVALLAPLLVGLGGPAHLPPGTRARGVAFAEDGRPSLAARIAARVADARCRPRTFGVAVVSLDTGEVVADRDATVPLTPASVAKVATSCAALDLLGPGWAFDTRVEARGDLDPATGTLAGALVVRGTGDPNLSKRGHETDPLYPLGHLARAVRAAGIVRVTGGLVLDDGPFDRAYLHPTWKASDVLEAYGAPIAGLVFNDACVTVTVRGGSSPGASASAAADGTNGPWPLQTTATTSDGGKTIVDAVWAPDRARLRVLGSIPARQEYAFDAPVPDPIAHFGGSFLHALAVEGVRVEGGARAAAGPADRAAGRVLARVENGLWPTLRVMNRRSQNLYASLVFKACGAAREGVGSWESGERAVADTIARRGIDPTGTRILDGSGLSRDDRVPALTLARLLAAMDADPVRGAVLRDSLAVPGEDGTLERRLRDPASRARLHAKTGTLARSGVHALAGYVDGAGGARGYAFALLLDRPPGDGDPRGLLDSVVREILAE